MSALVCGTRMCIHPPAACPWSTLPSRLAPDRPVGESAHELLMLLMVAWSLDSLNLSYARHRLPLGPYAACTLSRVTWTTRLQRMARIMRGACAIMSLCPTRAPHRCGVSPSRPAVTLAATARRGRWVKTCPYRWYRPARPPRRARRRRRHSPCGAAGHVHGCEPPDQYGRNTRFWGHHLHNG